MHTNNAHARIRADIRAMHAYAVASTPVGAVKLDAMENPHRLSAHLQTELGRRLAAAALNRYPAPAQMAALSAAIARHTFAEHGQEGLPAGWAMTLGNGSDEIISLINQALAQPTQPRPVALAPAPGFVMYAISAQLQGLDFVEVPLNAADFSLDMPAMLAAIERLRPALLWLAYPNNPTATLWDEADVAALIAAAARTNTLVVMDEAYQPFAARSWLPHMLAAPERHGHVLLMRTLSKFGLAGVRLGYLMGPENIVGEIEKIRPPYNISVLNIETALFALENVSVYQNQAQDICAQREYLMTQLRKIPQIQTVFDSQANMILIRIDEASSIHAKLKERGILIKNTSAMHPLLENTLRISVGTAEENQCLLKALAEILS